MSEINALFHSLVERLVGPLDQIGSFFDGRLAPGGGAPIALVDPASDTEWLRFNDVTPNHVLSALESCQAGQQVWAELSAQKRGIALHALSTLVAENAEPLAQLESLTSGKGITASRAQLQSVVEIFRYYAGWTDKFGGNVIPVPGGQLNYTLREPLGVVLAIMPWNSPVYLAAWNIAPALAMGNAVLLKPSELTPLTSLALAKLAIEAGFPPGVLNVINGLGQSVGDLAIANCITKKVVFVGSVQTGRRVNAAAAKRPIGCLLELGGKSANIVFEDADLTAAVKAAIVAGFANTGQNCAAGSRLLVHRSVYDRFVDAVAKAASEYRIGMPLDESTEGGPINNRAQFKRIGDMVQMALDEGATMAYGQEPPSGQNGFFVRPTVLRDVHNRMRIAQEEVFGPVVVAIPFDTEDEAIAIANDSEFGLAGAVWTRDIARGHRVAKKVRAGIFWINMYRDMHVATPFGGYDSSGYGRSSGIESLYEYTQTKSVWVPTQVGA
ncbi:aldehyde dehydrogenase family protein [Variovorax ginsengisoli]|uniref:Acyl-CoA reductase-like NAD-dependent aldehyde dehydrogenase n=1 Tax=Variovorax ginsengisoli TaxID=363844 RepID=A0ABT9S9V5_9BURK|nr:aldehyde dehydrogenase family protein [Variovorax ginsengisoli]MDP9901140.1 acyl-CoA reductase-like NAD-dependent aldehyde dehydrogenase [Variovorax ginsengisoli]